MCFLKWKNCKWLCPCITRLGRDNGYFNQRPSTKGGIINTTDIYSKKNTLLTTVAYVSIEILSWNGGKIVLQEQYVIIVFCLEHREIRFEMDFLYAFFQRKGCIQTNQQKKNYDIQYLTYFLLFKMNDLRSPRYLPESWAGFAWGVRARWCSVSPRPPHRQHIVLNQSWWWWWSCAGWVGSTTSQDLV